MSGDADPCDSKGNSPLQSSLALDGVQDFKGKALFDLGKIVFWIFLITAIWSRWQIALQDWLWIDELHTSWVVSGELRQVIPRAAAGNQSSPYFFLVFAVIQWLGQSPLTLRLVSALSGLLTFALASQWVAQKTGSIWAAIGALIFLGFDSTMVFCGTDARPYAVLQLLAVVSAIRLFRFLESTNRPVVAWDLVILCGLMVAIHPVGILFVSGIVLVLAVPLVKLPSRGGEPIGEVRWASKNKLLTPLMVVFGCIGGLALNPALGSILDRRSQWANITDWKQLLFDCVCLMLCAWILPSILISLSTRSESRLNASAQTTLERVFRKPSRLLLVLFVVPVMITLGLEFTGTLSLSLQRYLTPIWPMAGMAIGLSLGCVQSKRAQPLFALGISFGALMGTTVNWDNRGLHFRPFEHWTFLSVSNGIPSLRRSENWELALTKIKVAHVRSPHPGTDVYLLPNLLEEHGWKSLSPHERRGLEEYMKFPLSGIFALDPVKVRPTLESPHLLAEDLDGVKENDCLIFVIRASFDDLQMITNELYDEIASRHVIKDVVRHHVSESLHVVEFSVYAKP